MVVEWERYWFKSQFPPTRGERGPQARGIMQVETLLSGLGESGCCKEHEAGEWKGTAVSSGCCGVSACAKLFVQHFRIDGLIFYLLLCWEGRVTEVDLHPLAHGWPQLTGPGV